MTAVVKFNGWISTFDLSLRLGRVSPIAILLTFVFRFVVSDYFFAIKRKKLIFASSVGLVGLILLFV